MQKSDRATSDQFIKNKVFRSDDLVDLDPFTKMTEVGDSLGNFSVNQVGTFSCLAFGCNFFRNSTEKIAERNAKTKQIIFDQILK